MGFHDVGLNYSFSSPRIYPSNECLSTDYHLLFLLAIQWLCTQEVAAWHVDSGLGSEWLSMNVRCHRQTRCLTPSLWWLRHTVNSLRLGVELAFPFPHWASAGGVGYPRQKVSQLVTDETVLFPTCPGAFGRWLPSPLSVVSTWAHSLSSDPFPSLLGFLPNPS